VTRVLVFNFFGGVVDRGISLYAQDIGESMRRIGVEVVELRCPRLCRHMPRVISNLLFVLFEQLVAPVLRVVMGCSFVVYPYNSAGVVDAALGTSVLVIHDLMAHHRQHRNLAAFYIRVTQAVHRYFRRPVRAASVHTLRQLHRLAAFKQCSPQLWSNPFFAFEAALATHAGVPLPPKHHPLRVLLCSGLGRNKDYGGALRLFARSRALDGAELRVLGFGRDADLARRRLERLPDAVAGRAVVLPRLSLDDVVTEYLSADIVWVHSRREGFGRSVLEARLAGRRVVASNIGAFRQLTAPGVTLYRNGGFDAAVRKALCVDPPPPLNSITYHAPLEAAVATTIAAYANTAQLEPNVDSPPQALTRTD